jgi:hypothetical protein
MKTTLLSFAAFFVLFAGKAQSFTENFNGATISSLEASCWIMSGSLTTTQAGEAINSNSISTLPATNTNAKTDVYSPILNIISSSSTVTFDYRLTSSLNGNATRKIEVGFVNTLGQLITSQTVNLVAGTNTDVKQFNNTFTSLTPGNYRVVIRLSGSNGNGNARIVFDNFNTTNASLLLVNPGTCQFAPIVEVLLPIKLNYFTAQLNSASVDLKWATSTEINFSHFVIERSYNGVDFTDIATVFGAGNSTDVISYKYSDKTYATEKTVIYYRLRQVDIDAKEEFSATRIIHLGKQNDNIRILTYPNPVSNEIRITIPSTWQNKKVVYEMYSSNGLLVNRMEKANSSQTESISVNNLNSGAYFVVVKCNGETAQQKIIKQ